jgi:anti-sigma B factor antagonist
MFGDQNSSHNAGDAVQISSRRHGKVTIFDLSGDIDFANSRQLRESVLREIQENRTSHVMVNLSAVRYIDSSGIASLVEALKASRDRGTRFILFGLSTPAREVLQLSRLIKVFEIYGSEEQALASMGTAAAFTGNRDPTGETQ